MANQALSPSETLDRLSATAFVHLHGKLSGSYSTTDFSTANAFVSLIAEAADRMNHHPDVRLGFGKVDIELSSHDVGGVTDRDIALAEEIQRLADSAGATTNQVQPTGYELAIDTVDADAIRPFWQAGLDYTPVNKPDGSVDLVDPRGIGPNIWFQHMDPPRTDRNRIHVDVYVPTQAAASRVTSVLEAGGTLLTEEYAPQWWVMADVEGNELCICTSPV